MSKQCHRCCHCRKEYKSHTHLKKHVVLCNLLHTTTMDELSSIPSQREMFVMLTELGRKYVHLEEKVVEMNKWVVRKKSAVDVFQWLVANRPLEMGSFENFPEQIVVLESDIEHLLKNKFLDTIGLILERTVYPLVSANVLPLAAFSHKQHLLYIFDAKEVGGVCAWMEAPDAKLRRFFVKLQMKISKAFSCWKRKKYETIRGNDAFDILCDKALVKMMSVEFHHEPTLHKAKTLMIAKLKTDLSAV